MTKYTISRAHSISLIHKDDCELDGPLDGQAAFETFQSLEMGSWMYNFFKPTLLQESSLQAMIGRVCRRERVGRVLTSLQALFLFYTLLLKSLLVCKCNTMSAFDERFCTVVPIYEQVSILSMRASFTYRTWNSLLILLIDNAELASSQRIKQNCP